MTSMTANASSLSPTTRRSDGRPGLLREIRGFWRQFAATALNPYRPELHYMRGPGPAWRAKHAASANADLT
jgi:hypothetical protein